MRATGSAPAHILVVDDEPAITELLATPLRYMGYQVTVADSGFGALDAAASAAPDLVVLDVMLPDLDGFEVCVQTPAGERPAGVAVAHHEHLGACRASRG